MLAWAYISPLLGLALLFFGFVFLQTDDDDQRRKKRLLALPTTRIAEAKGGGVIELKGRVIAAPDEEPLLAPFSGRRVVWQRVGVESEWRTRDSRSWIHRAAHATARDFLLDDGSGEQARVALRAADGTHVDIDVEHPVVKSTEKGAPHPPEVRAYLEGLEIHAKDGEALRFREGVIAEGDLLVVIGVSTRTPLFAEGGYREQATRLVVTAGKRKTTGLFLSRSMEGMRVAEDAGFRGLAAIFLVAGLAVLASGGWCIYRVATGP